MRYAATRLAKERERRGMTQAQLADLLKLSPTSVSAVENGHVSAWPRFRREASRILGVAEETLFKEESRRG